MKVMLEHGAYMPERAHSTDAGLDLRCREEVLIPANSSATIDTGVHVALPQHTFGKIENKSGLNMKNSVVACGGVIDEGYTGSIIIKLYNFGHTDYVFKAGAKVAQMVIIPYAAPDMAKVNALDDTERGDRGFGSTGK